MTGLGPVAFRKPFLLAAVLCLALGASAGCNKKSPDLSGQKNRASVKNEPAWVARCGAAFSFAQKQELYGCGSDRDKNQQFQLKSADEKARVDLARTIDNRVTGFFKDYLSAPAMKGNLSEAEAQQFISSIARQVTEISLHGSQVFDRWRAPDGTLYSISRVSFDEVEAAMRKQANERVNELKSDPQKAMDEFDRQLAKIK
jgi:hypothetical protein